MGSSICTAAAAGSCGSDCDREAAACERAATAGARACELHVPPPLRPEVVAWPLDPPGTTLACGLHSLQSGAAMLGHEPPAPGRRHTGTHPWLKAEVMRNWGPKLGDGVRWHTKPTSRLVAKITRQGVLHP
eukprot:CAMPEP_0179109714 /NCGR_PEP_ID=MMETSP0796-20121207/51172_1 /TAXON_ID=73915 /ORGANISM="Pyrodinium bahamense, Strain pbaha01" /LENGTH=130 /DNA_ID=CAMNT_0020807833 /DNA_START=220 /DNA_END=610 /DNA_ORIENTATION=-